MLSKTALSAVKAFVALAELPSGEHLGAAAIADQTDAGPNYLGKLLKSLSKTGLLESQKGFGGGFRLGRDPSRISLFEVVEPIDHVSRWDGCFMGKGTCDERSPCAVHDRWKKVRQAYLEFLNATTIADLATKSSNLDQAIRFPDGFKRLETTQ